jgi:Glycosyl transferases group 1
MNLLLIGQTWFSEEFKTLGVNVTTVGKSKNFDVILTHTFTSLHAIIEGLPSRPDAIIFYDDSAPLPLTHFADVAIPTLFYSVDTHHHHVLHRIIGRGFSHICYAQKDYENKLRTSGRPLTWLPLWASNVYTPTTPKTLDVCFVGTLNAILNPERVAFFKALEKLHPLTVVTGNWGDYYPRSQIVINQTVKGDLNFRVFEAMGSGAMLLTESSGNGLLSLFSDKQHLCTYRRSDAHDAAAILKELLSNPYKIKEIADAGYHEIHSSHLAIHRAETLLSILASLSPPPQEHPGLLDAINFQSLGDGVVLTNKEAASAYYAMALSRLSDALTTEESIPADLSMLLCGLCLKFDFISRSSTGAHFISLMASRAPECDVIKYLIARERSLHGDLDGVTELLNCTSPDEMAITLAKVDKLVQTLTKPL